LLAAHAQAAAGQPISGVFIDHHRANFIARFSVDKNYRRTIFAPKPVAAPSPHRGEHVPERAALVRQAVFEPRRTFFVGDLLQQAFVDQAIEPAREHCARNFQRALEILEAAAAGECLAHH